MPSRCRVSSAFTRSSSKSTSLIVRIRLQDISASSTDTAARWVIPEPALDSAAIPTVVRLVSLRREPAEQLASTQKQDVAVRRRGQGPKPHGDVAVGAKHRGLDGAEHSAMLNDVLAGDRYAPHPARRMRANGGATRRRSGVRSTTEMSIYVVSHRARIRPWTLPPSVPATCTHR
jgi:hypothetical protein